MASYKINIAKNGEYFFCLETENIDEVYGAIIEKFTAKEGYEVIVHKWLSYGFRLEKRGSEWWDVNNNRHEDECE